MPSCHMPPPSPPFPPLHLPPPPPPRNFTPPPPLPPPPPLLYLPKYGAWDGRTKGHPDGRKKLYVEWSFSVKNLFTIVQINR